ncbi:Tetratricopeptide-like helical domain-containing protein [Dioscorea alata]|uniref:Tetratricopeptide-like helical domain-containing protein n=1 Tax=Dioscorea alata TaxID=55571 RepID=A0ACB7U1Q9_DIOAL|nr:Tetratricopeptide-like helical domain-containing protein [Dioscorea alata]
MSWFSNCLVRRRRRRRRELSTLICHLLPQWLLTPKTHSTPPPILPSNHSHGLLSLLLYHQPKRHPSLQVHAQLLTTALHRPPLHHAAVLVWNTLLRHYSLGPSPQEAIYLYHQMQHLLITTNSFTFSFLLKACANLSSLRQGSQLHTLVVKRGFESNVYVHTSLLDMYVCCRALVDARKVFDEMPERNAVTWNVIITGLARHGEISMAWALFQQMPERNAIAWTGMIDGYTRARRPVEALSLLVQMLAEGVSPTEVTILAVVPAISTVGALGFGESMHAFCDKNGIGLLDVRVENSLIDMYAKCGSIDSSMKVFERMSWRRNLVSWTSVISAFAMHGMASKVVGLLKEMKQENFRPNRVTFLSVLNACSHGGLVEEGMRFFSSMVYEYRIEPEIKHFGCMIDMLGRAGRLWEAEKLIGDLPGEVNVIVWRTLLGCCSKHGDVGMGERVMRRILEMEKGYGGDYVILSNMLSEAGRFGDAEGIRGLMDERHALKVPGVSLVAGKD